MVGVGVMLMSVTSVMSPLVSPLVSLSPSLVLLIKAGTSILYLTAPGPPPPSSFPCKQIFCEVNINFKPWLDDQETRYLDGLILFILGSMRSTLGSAVTS